MIEINANYKTKYGFNVAENYVFKTKKGLNEGIVNKISEMKDEPKWMRDFRLRAYKIFCEKPMPTWGGDLSKIDFDNIYYYLKPTDNQKRDWEDVPIEMKETFEKLGIPQAERQHLAGVKAQFDSEVIYGSLLKELEDEGIIFLGTDEALKKYPHFFEEYFGKLIPPSDNKFAALNSAVWSGGSFVYIPKGAHVKRPLQAYFRINAQNMGQFERTLIIADEGSYAHYVEGCFTKGHKIKTKTGYKNIEEIATSDLVFTHKGNYKKVYNIQKRKYSGYLYKIKVWGDPDNEIEVTEEHPFLSVGRKLRNERNKNFSPAWVKACDLKVKSYLSIPIDKFVEDGNLRTFAVDYKGKKSEVNLPMVDDLFRLIGYYLAEGSLEDRGYLKFSFNVNERLYIDDVKGIVKKIFKHEKFHEFGSKDKNGTELVISSVVIARIFKQFGQKANAKKLPDWVMYSTQDLQKEFIKGYFRGDGNYYNKIHEYGTKEEFRICTVSKDLAYQVRQILLRLGIVSCINSSDRSATKRQRMYTVYVGGDYLSRFAEIVGMKKTRTKINGKNRASMFGIDKDYAYLPISKTEKKLVKSINVYNFSVEGDESYTVNDLAVHNCTAPVYSSDSLHSAVVEVFVKKGARFKYTTIQNWSNDVYNLVTKRAKVEEDGVMEWVDGNLGSRLTQKYPSCYLVGERAHGEVLSIAYGGKGQHQDAGGKIMHIAPNTTSSIISKSISAFGGRTSYRGMISVSPSAKNAKSRVECDALILDADSRSDTFPVMRIDESSANIEHEATVSKIGEEKLFYLMSRGLTETEAMSLIVSGFIEPIVKELPLEYAIELNRLIELEMEGSVG